MRDWAGKRYWLVGASEGLGRALAHKLSVTGVELILSARSEDRLADLAAALPGRARTVPCDVTDDASVRAAAEAAGDINGVVVLAGDYWPMKASEWNAEHALSMAECNFVGCLRLLGHVVPAMVARDRGHIVLTGSLAGYRGIPGMIGYGASKAAVMNLAESLRADLRKTGVEVQLVNPGFIRTRMTEKNDFPMPMIMEPDVAARHVFEHMNGDTLSRSFPAPLSALFRLGQFLPDWAWYALFEGRR